MMQPGSRISDLPPLDRRWALAELLGAAALVVGANVFDWVPISETPWLVALGWLSLRRRGRTWRSLGLRRPDRRITAVGTALVAGLLYLEAERDLWVPILAHGFTDTIALALIYFGLAPGLPG